MLTPYDNSDKVPFTFAEENQLNDKFNEAKNSVTKAFDEAKESIKEQRAENDALKQPLEGSYIRYEVTYIGGIEAIPKAKVGAVGKERKQ